MNPRDERLRMIRPSRILLATLSVATSMACNRESAESGTVDSSESMTFEVQAPNGMVASSQPLATAAGLDVLREGGNAVDAAVTMAAVLNVVEPMMTGIGGDMFALLWLAEEQRLVGLNASGRAGSLADAAALWAGGQRRMRTSGATTITVPGALNGWAALLGRYGTITLAQALAPAIRIARSGFAVTPVSAEFWRGAQGLLRRDEGARATFLVDGLAPGAGDLFVNPDVARTLELIAAEGPSVLYDGPLGQSVVARVQELGGFLTMDDLRSNEAEWIEPISVSYHGYRVWELPPNGQGIAALEMLRILEGFDLAGMGHNSPDYLHHLIEAKKLAYADLEHFVGDPEHMAVEPPQLLDDRFIQARRDEIDPGKAMVRAEPGRALGTSETTYLTTADSKGNMVSFINSLAGAFGSAVVVPGTGFALQNRGVGFTLEPGRPNTLAPGRRPFHTIIPAFVTKLGSDGDEQPWLSLGAVGGFMQPQAHVQILLNLIHFGMTPQQAVDAPRFNHLRGNSVAIELGVSGAVRETLSGLGHDVLDPGRTFFGGAQLIMRLPSGWAAASDSRMDGLAAGH
jgi:gamma-glutamyltranspeptidase/glutathione hydrolase